MKTVLNETTIKYHIHKAFKQYAEIKPTETALSNIYNDWLDGKSNFISILENNPNWLPNELAVVVPVKFNRGYNVERAWYSFCNLSDACLMFYSNRYEIRNLAEYVICNSSDGKLSNNCSLDTIQYKAMHVSDRVYESIKNIQYGMKLSRLFRKIFEAVGVTSNPYFEKFFAKLADELNPIERTYKFVISVNPVDYLLMSHGNSWRSCHMIDGGCYQTGTLSYMGDHATVIGYLVDNSTTENFAFAEKINRCCFHMSKNMMCGIQSRLYPDNDREESALRDTVRKEFENQIAAACGVANQWTKSKQYLAIKTYEYSTHYSDYDRRMSDVDWFVHNENKYATSIEIGSSPRCLRCGKTHDSEEYFVCRRCRHSADSEDNDDIEDYLPF